jgi:hypothetical protein
MKFLTWPWSKHPAPKVFERPIPKLDPFFFFPHGAEHAQLDRALKRLAKAQAIDDRAARVAFVLTRKPNVIGTVIKSANTPMKVLWTNSLD